MTRSKNNLLIGTTIGNYTSADNGLKWTKIQSAPTPWSCLITYNDTTYSARASITYSTDGGNNWTALKNMQGDYVNSILKYKNRIFAGTWLGIMASNSQGDFQELESLPTSQVTSIAELNGRIHVTTKNGIYYSDDQCTSWKRSYYNPIFGAGCLISDGSRLYVATGGGTISNRGNISVYISDDNGITWTPSNTTGSNGLPGGVQAISDLVENDGVIFAAYRPNTYYKALFKSTDKGENWTVIATLGSNAYISNVYNLFKVKSEDGKSAVIYACTNLGFFRSADNGVTWVNPTGGTVNMTKSSNYVRSIIRVGNELLANSLYLTHRSNDNGVTWTDDPLVGSTGLGTTENMIEDKGSIFVGTNGSGIYMSSDVGKTWTDVTENFPYNMRTNGGFYNIGGKILLGTETMGVWARKGDLPLAVSNIEAGVSNKRLIKTFPNPGRGTIHFTFTTPVQSSGTISIVDISGRNIITLPVGKNGTQWETEKCLPGIYFYNYQSGMKRESGKLIIE